MAIRLPSVLSAKYILHRSNLLANHAATTSLDVPKGHFAVYVGEGEKKKYVIPVSFESAFISRTAKCHGVRIWLQSSNGRPHNSLHRRKFPFYIGYDMMQPK